MSACVLGARIFIWGTIDTGPALIGREVLEMINGRDIQRISHLRPAGNPQPAGDPFEGPEEAPYLPTRARRRNRCRICGRMVADSREFCSYCVQYVN